MVKTGWDISRPTLIQPGFKSQKVSSIPESGSTEINSVETGQAINELKRGGGILRQ